jgi:dTMP kinase
MTGLFITLEGIDGCGKSTHLEMLRRALSDLKMDVVVTREPGGTSIGERIRALLLAKGTIDLAPQTELLLMIADRAQHVVEFIRPALQAGRIVISDRYADSSLAFQGYGRGIDLETVYLLNRVATGGVMPDITILFDVRPEVARERLRARRPTSQQEIGMTRFDDEEMGFHSRVREGYLELAKRNPERIRIVDASGSVEQTHARAFELVMELRRSVPGNNKQ